MTNITTLTKKAWEIRRESASKYDCKIMDVSWRLCLDLAREYLAINNTKLIDKIKRITHKQVATYKLVACGMIKASKNARDKAIRLQDIVSCQKDLFVSCPVYILALNNN